MIVTIMPIATMTSMGGIPAATYTVMTGLVLDAVETKRLSIQNTGNVSHVTGMIKNSDNTDTSNVVVIVTLDVNDKNVD